MKRLIPGNAVDSQLHFIVTSQRQGWVTTKEANEAIKKLLNERRKNGRYNF